MKEKNLGGKQGRWILPQYEKEKVEEISHHFLLSLPTILFLLNRKIEREEIESFLFPSPSHLHSPFLFPGMELATQRVLQALKKKEKILIFGDYDADGITSVSLLLLFFRELKVPCYYYIPHRVKEGYGLNPEVMEKAKKEGISLIITCDCGTTSSKEIEFAKTQGIEVIITDHHRPKEKIPPALSILNPEVSPSYPFSKLAGVGVVFKFLQALSQKIPSSPDPFRWIDLVALGTVTDLAPLRGENRVLVKLGLEKIKRTEILGLKALMKVSGIEGREIDEYTLGYILAPRLNACGRLSLAKKGVKLLVATSFQEALTLSRELNRENIRRKTLEEKMRREAEILLEKEVPLFILFKEDWHPGIVGLVASYLKEKYYRPALVFSREGKILRGSGRSIPSFSLFESLKECEELLLEFGGHSLACGLALKEENFSLFKDKMKEIALRRLEPLDLTPSLWVDGWVKLEELGDGFFEELSLFPPYGVENPPPLFLTKLPPFSSLWKTKKGGVRFFLPSSQGEFEAYYFGEKLPGEGMRVLFTPRLKGKDKKLMLTIVDIEEKE